MSQNIVRLVLVLHNHQPIGNFDNVFEQAYQDSYLPFLDIFEEFPKLRIGLHTSGSLMEWIDAHHPEYIDRLSGLVAKGQIEIVGGAYYEPILTMIPSRDRIGQIKSYSEWLENRLGAKINGMWIPERVWEQSLTSDIASAGIRYTILDDFHFKNSGLTEDELHGHYLTEHDSSLLTVFPGSEPLRYLIPFGTPQETINYLRSVSEKQENGVVVFGDDGEKFGTWPNTKEHVYDRGWLRQFFTALSDNSEWLKVTTPTEALENTPSLGKTYIPEGSYREMTEWALPATQLNAFNNAKHELETEDRWEKIQPFVRGGFWRNFKAKYPETNEMYARMQMISKRLQTAIELGAAGEQIEQARVELYRAQCNCSYWHGAFGGTYLPHLRNAIYNHLIAADNLLEHAAGRGWDNEMHQWVELDSADYNLDGRPEVKLTSNRLTALVDPNAGGTIYELDIHSICHNLLATLNRREEAYHQAVLGGPSESDSNCASIHDQVIFKQSDLDKKLQYDTYLRKSLVDHFFVIENDPTDFEANQHQELGDFVEAPFQTKLRRSEGRKQVQMTRTGKVTGRDAVEYPVTITKGITLESGSSTLEISYLLEGLPTDQEIHFGIEFNFAGLPSGAEDRFFHDRNGKQLGQLESRLNIHDVTSFALKDEWLGIDTGLTIDRPASVWTFPIETVSQSEGGFELVHQSVVVLPHWWIQADAKGRWSVTMKLATDTSMAESRMGKSSQLESV